MIQKKRRSPRTTDYNFESYCKDTELELQKHENEFAVEKLTHELAKESPSLKAVRSH